MSEEEVKSPDPKPARRTKTAIALDWGSKSLIAVIPALATGYFAMKQAKFEADVEIARINAKAGAGYETLVDAFKKLEARAEEHERVIRELSQLLARERDSVADSPTPEPVRAPARRPSRGAVGGTIGAGEGLGAGSGRFATIAPTLTPPEKLFRKQADIKLPETLDEAAELKATR